MDDLVEAKVSVQVLLPYSVMLSEEPFDARAEMVDRAEPGFLFRYLRVHSYFLRYFQRSLIAVQRVMGDRAALVYYSVPRLSQLYSARMPAADVLQDRFPCFVRPYSYGFLLAGYPAELLPSPDPSAQSAVSLVDLDGRARKDRLFPPFPQPQEKDSPVSPCRVLAYACRFGGIPDGPVQDKGTCERDDSVLSDPSSVIQGPCGTAEGLMAVLAEVSPSAVGGDMAVPDDMASMAAGAFIRLDVEQRPYSQELLLPFLFPSHRRILGVCKNHT